MCIFEFTAHNMQRGMTLSLDNYSSPSLGKWKCSDLPSSANMGRSTVNYQQSLAHIYHVMIIVTGGFSKIAGLTAFNFTSPSSQKILQHGVFLRILQNFYERLCQFDKATVQWWVSVDLLFLIKTKNVGWFLLRRFADLVRVCYLHIISRKHSSTLLLVNLQKTKTCPK